MREPSYAQLSDEERRIEQLVGRAGSGRRVSEIKAELGETMDKYVAVFRDEDGLRTALEIVRRLKEEARTSPSTTRARSSTRTCSARSSCSSWSTTPRRS